MLHSLGILSLEDPPHLRLMDAVEPASPRPVLAAVTLASLNSKVVRTE